MRTIKTPDGRTFVFVKSARYFRKDGKEATIEHWASACRRPDCSAHFIVTVPEGADPTTTKAFGRVHCADHKLTRAECLALAAAARTAKKLSITKS